MPTLSNRLDRLESITAAADVCTCQYAVIVIVDHDAPEPQPVSDVCSVCGGKQLTRCIVITGDTVDGA
jgi:hypothetical protein